MAANPQTKGYAENFEKLKKNLAEDTEKWKNVELPKWEKEIGEPLKEKTAEWQKEADAAKAAGMPVPPKPVASRRAPVDPTKNPWVPSVLYNGMIAPILPYGIKGAIWYQGESNAGSSAEYDAQFPTMINDWRARWGEGQFPFFWVQLANFMRRLPKPTQSSAGWPRLREAQSKTLSLPATGQAVIIDIGDGADIHPRDKMDVGKRLALAARHVAYGEDIVYSGPVYDSLKVEGDKAVVKFKQVGGGLTISAPPATRPSEEPKAGSELKGFAIAGADKKFVWADAKIEGDTVVVSSPEVKEPVAVRYAWADNPECNLYNKEGLPASPFRTDDFVDPPTTKQDK
jgi:sialate O-acetylesterase